MDVQKFINNWKSEQKIGNWTSEKLNFSIYENEELFIIKVELILKSTRKNYQISSHANENFLTLILKDLENQLMEEYSKIINEEINNLLKENDKK